MLLQFMTLQKHSEAIQKMADQVKINWEKLRRNFEKLAASVDAALNQLAYVIYNTYYTLPSDRILIGLVCQRYFIIENSRPHYIPNSSRDEFNVKVISLILYRKPDPCPG